MFIEIGDMIICSSRIITILIEEETRQKTTDTTVIYYCVWNIIFYCTDDFKYTKTFYSKGEACNIFTRIKAELINQNNEQ